MPWSRARDTAAALEGAIMAMAPDAQRLAGDLARECSDRGAPEVAEVAGTIERALFLIADGQIEPHHGQWQMAATMAAVRQALDHLHAGETYAPVALAGARYELETLFPVPPRLITLSGPRTPRT